MIQYLNSQQAAEQLGIDPQTYKKRYDIPPPDAIIGQKDGQYWRGWLPTTIKNYAKTHKDKRMKQKK